MARRFAQPVQDGILFMPLDSCNTADAARFGDQRQRFQDIIRRRSPPVEERTLRFGERSTTGFAAIALTPRLRQTILLEVRLPGTLRLAIVRTVSIRTAVTDLGSLGHGSLLNGLIG